MDALDPLAVLGSFFLYGLLPFVTGGLLMGWFLNMMGPGSFRLTMPSFFKVVAVVVGLAIVGAAIGTAVRVWWWNADRMTPTVLR